MDEVRIVKKRSYVVPLVIGAVVLALVIAYVFFMNHGGASVPWNGTMNWPVEALDGTGLA